MAGNFLAGVNRWYLMAAVVMIPVFFDPTLTLKNEVQDTLFVLDISESMNVTDVEFNRGRVSRLEAAKQGTREAMSSLNCGSRVSLGLFAGDQVIVLFEPLEICRHFSAIDQVVSAVSTHMRWIGDSIIENGLLHAIEEARGRQLNLIFVTDGDEMPHKSAPRVTQLEKQRGKFTGATFIVGGQTPLPVPKVDGSGEVVGYWTQEEAVKEGFHPNLLAFVDALTPGQSAPEGMLNEVGEHLSGAKPDYLKVLAHAAGMGYQPLKKQGDTSAFIATNAMTKTSLADSDVRWVFSMLACMLIMCGWFETSPVLRRFFLTPPHQNSQKNQE